MGDLKKQESIEEGKKIVHTYPLLRVSVYINFKLLNFIFMQNNFSNIFNF